ncbi:MAG: SusC/RagA family TonB-linked outer membrane protein [Marinifilaceae bacterium]|nr:SusC/RagA family TonB-linked outer membrane protein [Marinifilaceae bacterium]
MKNKLFSALPRGKMKIARLFSRGMLLMLFCALALGLKAQSVRVSLDMRDVTLNEVIVELKKQTRFDFFYNSELLKFKGRTTVKAVNKDFRQLLNELLPGFGLEYSIEGQLVVIREQQLKGVLLKGVVLDKTEMPLPGATVTIKGTTIGTSTDSLGRFVLNVPNRGKIVLVVSFIGYETKEIPVGEQTKFRVVLQEKEESLDEVVVTGYQMIRKSDVVGSTNTIKGEDMVYDGTNSIEQMLQGKLPGLVVMNTSGLVGTRQKVRVRGTSTLLGNQEPVWVVDGIIQEDPLPFDAQALNDLGDNFDMMTNFIGNSIAWLNPGDIENITVLKDASATVLYGVKAANGVIVITTKKGEKGRLSVTYSGGLSVTEKLNYHKMNLMNSKERIDFSREIYEKRLLGQVPTTSVGYEHELYRYLSKEISYKEFNENVHNLEVMNTDWMDILYQTQMNHNHALSVSGGNEKATYYGSFNYSQNKGAARGNEVEQFGASFRMDAQVRKNINIGMGLSASYAKTEGFYIIDPYTYALEMSRAVPCFNENGDYFYYLQGGYKFNVLKELEETGNTNDRRTFNINFNFNWDIFPCLRFEMLGSFGSNNTVGQTWASEYSHYITNIRGYEFGEYLKGTPEYDRSLLPHGGELNTTEARNSAYTWRNSLSYNEVFGSHRVGVLVGLELRSTLQDQESMTVYGYFPDRGKNVTLPPTLISGGANSIYNRMKTQIVDNMSNYLSLYGSATYSFNERYVLTASVRSDASNRFGQDRRARFLPVWSIGGRWNVHNEMWMQSQKVFSELNMRVSLGWQGNVAENFGPDLVAKLPTNVVNNVTGEYELEIKSLPYADLRWEKTRSLNVGLDMGLFRNRVILSVEYYNKYAKDLIIYKDVPLAYGIEQMPINGGTMRNDGYELSLSTTVLRMKNFIWNISMNTAKNRNRIKSTLIPNASWTTAVSGDLHKEGFPVSAFWAFDFVGLDPEYGTPLFNIPDAMENEAVLNDATAYMKYMGKMEPDFTGGLSMSFRYKNLSLTSGFSLSIGGKRFLHTLFQSKNFPYSLPAAYDNLSKEFVNRWRKPGDELYTDIPAIPSVGEGNKNIKLPSAISVVNVYEMYDYSDIRVVNASFLRCNNISLTYNLSDRLLQYVGLKSIAFSASVSNPFMIVSKDYKGVDPEVATGGQPLSRVYSLRLNITF